MFDVEKAQSKLSKMAYRKGNIFIKKALLLGFSDSHLRQYIIDYMTSHTRDKLNDNQLDAVILKYNDLPNDNYYVLHITNDGNENDCDFITYKNATYDDCYVYIHDKVMKHGSEKPLTLMCVLYKTDNAICENIRKELLGLTSLTNVGFKAKDLGVRIWIRFPMEWDVDVIKTYIAKLEKSSTKSQIIKCDFNESYINSMIVDINHYSLINKVKLLHPWAFKFAHKLRYGNLVIQQKLEEYANDNGS